MGNSLREVGTLEVLHRRVQLARGRATEVVSVTAARANRPDPRTPRPGTGVAAGGGVRVFLVVMASWCVACAASEPVTRGRADREPPGAHCPDGGLAVHSGVDV